MRQVPWRTSLAATLALSLAVGCSSRPKATTAPSTAQPLQPIDPNTTGSIEGTVNFAGVAPPRVPIDMDEDPGCALSSKQPNLSEAIIVNHGALANVFVYVKDSLAKYRLGQPSQPAVLDQVGCRYLPHVLGIVTGQTLRITNSDKTMHNIHPAPQHNREWNESQMPGGAPIEHRFDAPELLVPITCNQHPWMKMYLNVVSNPFFAVSAADGKFTISGLPPGTYTLEAVHEKLGIQDVQVTIAAHENKAIQFAFSLKQ
jgi:plastocyanin